MITAITVWLIVTATVYGVCGWSNISNCYKMWFKREYWTDYNIVELIAWFTKAIIIVPGLIFNYQFKPLYALTLITSCLLIWASRKKLLPTLVGFNTIWVFISVAKLVQ